MASDCRDVRWRCFSGRRPARRPLQSFRHLSPRESRYLVTATLRLPTLCSLISPHNKMSSLLQIIDLHDPVEFDELLHQRDLCGWDKMASDIEAWRTAMDAGTRAMFWIVPPSLAHLPLPDRCAGHIALVSEMSPPNEELARPDKSILYISSLFIRPEHRGGLGRKAVQALESWAKIPPYGSPHCEAITLTALDRRYTEDDSEEWGGVWARFGQQAPKKGSSTEDWYARMGYVKWKSQPMFDEQFLDGTKIKLVAAFLRKTLRE
ncbi:hypothetical protein QC762_100520 [Podospora pseudocomata]|uniref:N-acetyltransferase domain-containing protein n=1 Tax=Podospora pseudocomata TaxID=2093779 RepID=A0ABR0GRA2_9PEZI|nr:hypothetical protein QC762_100520 [Podospora pseudocomata]